MQFARSKRWFCQNIHIFDLKFINDCGKHTLDLCTFSPKFSDFKCLNIKTGHFQTKCKWSCNFSTLHALLSSNSNFHNIFELAVITSSQVFPASENTENTPGRTQCDRLPSKVGQCFLWTDSGAVAWYELRSFSRPRAEPCTRIDKHSCEVQKLDIVELGPSICYFWSETCVVDMPKS